MFEFFKKYKNIILWVLVIGFCLIGLRLIYSYYGQDIQSFIYQDTSASIDRTFENQNRYPQISPKETLKNHFQLILPVLIIVGCIGFIYWILGRVRFLKLALLTNVIFIVILLLMVFAINPLQFLILLCPIATAYIFISSFIKPQNFINKVNFVTLLCFSIVIVMSQVLSLLARLNAYYFGIFSLFLLVISLFYSKNLINIIKEDRLRITSLCKKYIDLITNDKWISALSAALLCSSLWRMILIVYVPPNNGDGNMYHLSRVAHWLQNQSLEIFHSHDVVRQAMFPFVSDILLMWTMIASKSDFLCGFIQFACYVLTGSLIYQCLRFCFKFDQRTSLIPVLIWYALPQTVLESTSVQNDIVLSYFVFASLLFLLLMKCTEKHYPVFSTLALALAIGTKTSIYFYLVPFIFLFLVLFLFQQISKRQFVQYMGFFILFYMLICAYNHIQNFLVMGHPIAQKEFLDYVRPQNISFKVTISILMQNLFNIFVNQTGLQFYFSILTDKYNVFVAQMAESLFSFLNISTNLPGTYFKGGFHFNNWILKFRLHEDHGFYGLNGAIATVLVCWYAVLGVLNLVTRKSKINKSYFVFVYLSLGYLVMISTFYIWTPWVSRHLMLSTLLAMPLIAILIQSKSKLYNGLVIVMIIYSILSLIPTTFMNIYKPLVAYKQSIYGLSYYPLNRPEVRYTHLRTDNPNETKKLRRIDGIGWSEMTINRDRIGLRHIVRPYDENLIRMYYKMVPEGSVVGTILPFWQWDFSLFGENLSRQVYPLNLEILLSKKFDFLLISEFQMQHKLNLNDKEFMKIKDIIAERYVRIRRPNSKSKYIGHAFSGRQMSLYVPKEKNFYRIKE